MISFIALSFLLALANGDPVLQHSINPFFPNGRIVGGESAAIEDHPWQVSLQGYGFHFCGGSIISEDTILTAAHCTTSYPASTMKVRVGSARKSRGGVEHEVAMIIRHKDFKTGAFGVPQNDVAVLKLKSPIKIGKTAQPVKLFDQDEESVEGVLSTITGWGAMRQGGSSPDELRSVDVPIVSKEVCKKAYSSYGGIAEGQICAAYPAGGKDSCQGDSGGPLVINGRQAGIVSWGNGCARKGYPGVYTEVASVRDWLTENAGV